MAKNVTNYAEIQHDEIEALRSIYMEDFLEQEARPGAWNKVSERAFSIRLKASTGESANVALTLSVSLPNTYPKTVPKLHLSFDGGVRAKTTRAAQEVVGRKPNALLGSEMIFEICTLLQDILDHAVQTMDGLTLQQERAVQVAAGERKELDTMASKIEEETIDIETQPEDEDPDMQQTTLMMMQQAQPRPEKRKARFANKADRSVIEGHGGLQFDRAIDFEGSLIGSDTIFGRIPYRQGPVTQVFTVYCYGPGGREQLNREVVPHLLLKVSRFRTVGKVKFIKDCMLDLEDRLERLLGLKDNPNVFKPLGYTIKRSTDNDGEDDDEWYVGILVRLAPRGSMLDMLEAFTVIGLEPFRAWALQLLEGLQFLHRHRIAHSAIHLGNILLEKAETGNVVAKLSDGSFQHAMHLMQHGEQSSYSAAISPGWVAPEVINGTSVEALLPSDVWHLGICFLQMLFGLGVQSSYTSPKEFIDNLELSSSLEELLNKIFVGSERRATAFDLLPAAFLRSDDSLLVRSCGPTSVPEGFQSDRSTSEITRRRPESAIAPAVSRYKNDFVEAGRLGRGGYGEVYRSRKKLDGRFYAIKKIKSRSASALNDVLSEIMILSQLNHPYVVRYYNAWLEDEAEGQSDIISQSISTEDTSEAESDDGLDEQAPPGLDFMSQSGPDVDIVFESDSDNGADLEEDSEIVGQALEQDMISTCGDKLEDDRDESVQNGSGNLPPPLRRQYSSMQTQSLKSILYIQMEYCERKTLRNLISANIHENNVESWKIFRQILEGLAHIHALSIVHRDLKPENIFVDAKSDVRIGDFGLARHGDYQPSLKPTNMEEAYTVFTKSVGTTFYVAPEVRSAGRGQYNEKADMYSLGIIFFEMCVPMMTGMERADILGRLRERDHVLPQIFKQPEKSTQGHIICSLVDHDPARRPCSSELLTSEQIPDEVKDDKWSRNVLRHIHEAPYRKKLLAGLFPNPNELETNTFGPGDATEFCPAPGDFGGDPDDDKAFYPRIRPQEMTFDIKDRSQSADDLLLRSSVKERIVSIFRLHGAVPVDGPSITPFSSHYLRKYDQIVKLLSCNDELLQLPFDYTLPNARLLAKAARSPRKTYTFGDVYRDVKSGGAPRRIGEANFNIVSYGAVDLALREAEAIKVVDEVANNFPSMSSLPMCYYINHSKLFNAILGFCNIHPSKWALVKDLLGTLHGGQSNWSKLRANLRSPAIGVAATSVEELIRFDFRDPYHKAVSRLRGLLSTKSIEALESSFAHMEALTVYLNLYKVSRKVFLSPLSSVNESFYRDHLSFQCIFDTPKRQVFAAGGRYDQLIKSQMSGHQPRAVHDPHAVGFSFNWERLCTSMARYHKAHIKAKTKKKIAHETPSFRMPCRCEVLVDSSDRGLLHSTGIDIIQGLWANGISAELLIDTEADESNSIYNPSSESKGSHTWIVYIKQDGNLKVRKVAKKEESEIQGISELLTWFRNELRERDRLEGRSNVPRLSRPSSHQASGPSTGEHDVRIITSATKGKKFNRKNVIEQANAVIKDTVNGFLDSPILAIEVKDDIFERIRETRLSDTESWKRFIQNTPADDRAYLKEVQKCLQDMATERPEIRSVFVYNFRGGKSCIYYDLG